MSEEKRETIPFYPEHVRSELKVIGGLLLLMAILGVVGLVAPLGLGPPADPLDTPAHVKPEWYFLALYQLLKYIPKTTGVVLPLLGVGVLLFWPFLARRSGTTERDLRRRGVALGILVLVFIVLTIWGEVS
jgi:quinol-cytochrome oxidoreductase complex cytochrome b subunit